MSGSGDQLEKLKAALHPISQKNVRLLTTATNNPLFLISSKIKGEEDHESYVNADEFQKIYLKSIVNESEDLILLIEGQLRHIRNHVKNQRIDIEHDMKTIESF